ncbi:hypothetical protein GCM10011274_04930 [Paraglaciecola chathamensis]|uniref:Uncharacterized protein n=2 Tax=Paraglaciecola chathamensis TaxID=368405 RepID=A0A8H9I832_9ALTE|nr:hypothetical protein GAGA_1390 [Paraglaciecola agarilytica NO2]GGZ49873.1 hypothetical protein GCM10011274_04930 [Paraglaciecola oceanifecundans]
MRLRARRKTSEHTIGGRPLFTGAEKTNLSFEFAQAKQAQNNRIKAKYFI